METRPEDGGLLLPRPRGLSGRSVGWNRWDYRFQDGWFRLGFGFVFSCRRRGSVIIVERETRYKPSNLQRVQRLALQQSFRKPNDRFLVLDNNLPCAAVLIGDNPLHFLIDLYGGVFAVVLMLSYLPSEKYLFFLLAERYGPKRRHSELADHSSRKLRSLLYVVRGSGCHVIKKDFFRDSPAHHNRDLAFKVVASMRVAVALRKLHRDAKRHSTRND